MNISTNKPKVIVICGPTASGKTALSIELAKKMKSQGFDATTIHKITDLSIEEINNL